MKKVLSAVLALCLCVGMLLSSPAKVYAATLSGSCASSVVEGSNITITFAVSGATVTSGSIEISYSGDFELVSGKWLVSGTTLASFDATTKKGAMAFSSAKALSGNYFQLVLKAKKVTNSATVKATVILKNGTNVVDTKTVTKTVKITCKSHSWGAWDTKEATCTKTGSKARTCSVCGTKETETIAAKGHKVDKYSTTKEPTCTGTGTESGKCTVCGETVSRSIAATGHKWDTKTEITKEPTCTEKGTETATCTVCGATTNRDVEALGHDWGVWVVVTPSSCSVAGDEVHNCKRCGVEEHRDAELAPHDFGDSVTEVRAATIAVPGLTSGTCVNCGIVAEQETSCAVADEATGITISADEGVFRAGTEMEIGKEESVKKEIVVGYDDESAPITEMQEQNEVVAAIGETLAKTTEKFEVYTVDALVDGEAVAPGGEVTVTIPIPEDYSDMLAVLNIAEDGTTRVLGSEISEDGKSLVVKTRELGNIVVCDLTQPEPEPEPEPEPLYRQMMGEPLYLGVAGGALLVLFLLGFLIGRASKKNKKKD